MLKVYAFLTRLESLDQAAFAAHWRHPHGTLTKRIPQIRRYAQHHAIGDGALPGLPGGGWSGIATIWLDDAAALGAAAAEPDWPALDADGDNMYRRDQLAWLQAHEQVVRVGDGSAAAQPTVALLFLKGGGALLDEASLRALAEALAAALPGAGALRVATVAEVPGAFDGVIELGADDADAFGAAWSSACADLLRGRGIDPAACRAFLSREERVIWPAAPSAGDAA